MSVKTFKPHFHKSDFEGPLARHYEERADLFQQFVGAFLRERFGTRVHVSPTKGQDGGIDTFVDAGNDPNESFLGLSFPLIVECKDHDDTLGGVINNVMAGWNRVKKKLTDQAAKGWTGTFQPWKIAKSYLYIVSAVMPHPQSRTDLGISIADFFLNLPANQKPAIGRTHLLDWSDLQPLLNEHSRLVDGWLGIGHAGIIGHEAHEAGLSGFREYLKEENLSYIYPHIDDPTHPRKMLDRLIQDVGSKGVMLVGAGGVGKTRACFEVAKLAHHQGWRVLHITPGEPAVTVQDIENAVLQGVTPTLLVFDYLEQLGGIDWGTIRHRFLPNAKLRSLPIALLANARPGILLRHANMERSALFSTVELFLHDREELISTHLQETLAPKASYLLTAARVKELCGTRPIIGMFIARELERYAVEGRLDASTVARLRGGDLQSWINRRFQEDGLTPKITEELLPPTPGPLMIAAAAGLAAAPLRQNEMVAVLENTLKVCVCGNASSKQKAPLLLTSLIRSGWLEERENLLSAPHDVVADELLELTLCDLSWQLIRPGLAEQVLNSGKSSPRVLGRFSVSLDRILGQVELPEGVRQQLQKSFADWLEQHASELGKTLLQNDVDEVSYALGAVVTGFAWHEAVFRSWEMLIAPWLARNSRNAEARHLLYRGLKGLPEGKAGKLGTSAVEWLEVHHLILDASYILGPLLGRADLPKEAAKQAVTAALAWLAHAEHGHSSDAGFVLHSLLGRSDLPEEAAKQAVPAALTWLAVEEHGKSSDAGFVLPPLLGRLDLPEEAAKQAVPAALAWLADVEHGKSRDAQFVLNSLLGRLDLPEEAAKQAVTAALTWLAHAEHGHSSDAGFVLHSLLGRDLPEEAAKQAVTAALAWLAVEEHGKSSDANFVLPPLLGRDLPEEAAKQAVTAALAWLAVEEHGKSSDAQFVLHSLLGRDLPEETAEQAVTAALAWLAHAEHGHSSDAGFVLPPLLGRADLPKEAAKQAVTAALAWLGKHYEAQDAEFVLKNVLRKSNLNKDQRLYCIRLAILRLERIYLSPEASFLLKYCLGERTLTGSEREKVVKCSILWLRAHEKVRESDFVFKRLLRDPSLGDTAWREVADIAFVWLDRTPATSPGRDHTLNSLVTRLRLLSRAEEERLDAEVASRLQFFPDAKENKRLQISLKLIKKKLNPATTDCATNTTITDFSLSDFLRAHADQGTLPDGKSLQRGLDIAILNLANNHPGSAGYFLTALLPLSSRSGDDTFYSKVKDEVSQLIKHPKLTPAQKKGFSRASYKLLQNGAWADQTEGEKNLVSLGIEREKQ